MNVRYYMIMLLIPLLAINLVRNLKLLVPFSELANVITFAGLGIVLWYIFNNLPPISSRPLIGEPRKYTLFVGTTLFAVEAFGVVSDTYYLITFILKLFIMKSKAKKKTKNIIKLIADKKR